MASRVSLFRRNIGVMEVFNKKNGGKGVIPMREAPEVRARGSHKLRGHRIGMLSSRKSCAVRSFAPPGWAMKLGLHRGYLGLINIYTCIVLGEDGPNIEPGTPETNKPVPEESGAEASVNNTSSSSSSSTSNSSTGSSQTPSPNRENSLIDAFDGESNLEQRKAPSEPDTVSPSSLLQAAHRAIMEIEGEKAVAAHSLLIPNISPEDLISPQVPVMDVGALAKTEAATIPGPVLRTKPSGAWEESLTKSYSTAARTKRVDIPLRNISVKSIVDTVAYEEKVVMKGGNNQQPRFEAQGDTKEDIEGGVKSPEESDPAFSIKGGREYIIPPDEPEDLEIDDESDSYEPPIQPAQLYSESSEEEDKGKRKKKKQTPSSASRVTPKRAKQNEGDKFSISRSFKYSYTRKFEVSVPEYNYPGAKFTIPEAGGAEMAGLRACEVSFEFELSWNEDFVNYNLTTKSCTVCRFCVRPRCGLCAGCNGKPGGTKNSGHDDCVWRRCPYRAWKSEDKGKSAGGTVNDAVITRMWVASVNTFCLRGFDEQTKRIVKRRLQLYNMMINMTAAAEREFWLNHAEAFMYPRLNIDGGEKFHEVYRNLEVARYKVNDYSHRIKAELGLNPAKTLDLAFHETNIRYRARWPEKTPIKAHKSAGKSGAPVQEGQEAGPPVQSTKKLANRQGMLFCSLKERGIQWVSLYKVYTAKKVGNIPALHWEFSGNKDGAWISNEQLKPVKVIGTFRGINCWGKRRPEGSGMDAQQFTRITSIINVVIQEEGRSQGIVIEAWTRRSNCNGSRIHSICKNFDNHVNIMFVANDAKQAEALYAKKFNCTVTTMSVKLKDHTVIHIDVRVFFSPLFPIKIIKSSKKQDIGLVWQTTRVCTNAIRHKCLGANMSATANYSNLGALRSPPGHSIGGGASGSGTARKVPFNKVGRSLRRQLNPGANNRGGGQGEGRPP